VKIDIMRSSDFAIEILPRNLQLVDKKLKSIVPKYLDGIERLLQASGKKLRPSLVFTIVNYTNKEVDEAVINAAASIELIHIASLVHDDIIDNGTLRWGLPTINAQEGNDAALIAGDYLFAKGCALAASISAESGFIAAETITELCLGQAIELKDQFNINRDIEALDMAIKGKTSALFIAACRLGGMVSGLDSMQIKVLVEFAEYFGIAFQYMDDVKNFTESALTTGKSASSDVAAGNYTLPVILSLCGPHKTALKKLLQSSNVSAEEVMKVLSKDDSINKTFKEAQRYKKKALLSLTKLKNQELKSGLEEFISSL
jgi:heptaprenyl diphosphate synthase